MLPASLAVRVSQIEPHIAKVLTFLERRLQADLSDVNLVGITFRPKTSDSIFQKLQTGRYGSMNDLSDLAALTVVVLYRKDVQKALGIVKRSGLVLVGEPTTAVEATDFRYREPKVYVKPPVDYLERNPGIENIVAEVQFTTALQHALDITTHDFDYKGRTYSWSNFRLVAQLRAMLELVDSMIDDIENVAVSNEAVEAPPQMVYASAILEVLVARFNEDALPADRKRFAETVGNWASAIDLTAAELGVLLDQHPDLMAAQSIDPASAVLGALLRSRGNELVARFDGRFCISSELDSLCHEARQIVDERRVDLG